MKGPTICRLPCGSARRTTNPSPRSRVRGTMMSSSASQVLGSPSTGSSDGCQLMGTPLICCGDYNRNCGIASKCLNMSSLRKQGPILRVLSLGTNGRYRLQQWTTVVMGPRVRGDDMGG